MTQPATRIFLVRHGQTEWNKQSIFRGLSDVALDATGQAQAKALGRYFTGIPLHAIFTSRLVRAQATAQAIFDAQSEHQKVPPLHVEEGLTDLDRGEWEGLSHEAAKEKYPALYKEWFTNPASVSFPGGTSLKDVQRKAWHAFERISREAEGISVALVSHHIVLRVLLCSLFNLDLNRFRQFEVEPASISEIRLEFGQLVLYRLNETSHMKGLPRDPSSMEASPSSDLIGRDVPRLGTRPSSMDALEGG